jgi:hypothetical protein
MRLYHYTNLAGLIGADSLAVLQKQYADGVGPERFDAAAIASPSSILKAGLRPHSNGEYDHLPLPACVWLTSSPQMSKDFITGNTLDRGDWRVTVAIPESDRRLVYWPSHHCKLLGRDYTISADSVEQAHMLARELSGFYVYFGSVPRSRIRAVDHGRQALAEAA